MKRFISAISVLVLLAIGIVSLVACGTDTPDTGTSGSTQYLFDPYFNRFKPDVPTGKSISVSGKDYYFEEIEIRNKDEEKQVNDERSLRTLYGGVFVRFTAEDTVPFIDYSGFFTVPETKGVREGNVLTVSATNKTGTYTYDIRIEIHEGQIYVIHNAHHYNDPCTYSTIIFSCD